MSVEIVMPRAGLTMVEGTISTWKAAEGSQVRKGDVLMEYENEKSMIDCEALDSGILHIVAPEGETVQVGGLIGYLAQDQAEYDALVKGGGTAAPAPAPAETPAAAPAAPAASAAGVTEIPMPRAGLTMVEGTIVKWNAAEGEQVSKGQVVMEYENEKNTIEYEIVCGGYLHIAAPEGETVQVGKPIAYVADTKAQYDQLVHSDGPAASGVSAAEDAEKGCARNCPTCVHTNAAPEAAPVKGRIRATGLAKKLAKEAGIDLADVTPSGGPDGLRIVAKDIEAYKSRPKAAPAAAPVSDLEDEITETPWTGIRKTIARNMFNSLQQTAQNTCVCEVDATELLALREKLVGDQEMLGCKITVNDLLCKMLGKTISKHPLANATFDGSTLYSHKHVHLSVAVGADDGLVVPVVRNVDVLSVPEISAKMKDLAARAKSKQLRPEEQTGGTFTITNVGMFPIDIGTPIINLPQVAICGFGRCVQKPAVLPDGTIGPRYKMNVFLTFDHRIIDGLECGRIFKDIQYYIEHPEMILV
ncbi:MAG: 2-oxo acid dehydrogenase subunit E2 [Oscillibacter sp.]|nr:2-oxo acid dehydrogenase subunit E2 [Oscillibacter sp.]